MSSDKANPFLKEKYLNLETYRKNGQPVITPVWFVFFNEITYVVTNSNTGKIKRLNHTKKVRIAPCGFKGEPKGDWIEGTTHFADEFETEQAIKLRRKKYGLLATIAGIFSSRKGKPIVVGVKI
jgi:PPOX class probable F420-dependent enzyme